MKKILFLIFCLLVFSPFCMAEGNNVLQSYSSNSTTQTKSAFPSIFHPIGSFFRKIFKKKRIVKEYPANVSALFVSRNDLTASCSLTGKSCSETQIVEIVTIANEPVNYVFIYKYAVSAGKIIGEGAKVVWDLSGVAPGTYTITAGVDDGCGVCGMTKTQTVKIIECPNCH